MKKNKRTHAAWVGVLALAAGLAVPGCQQLQVDDAGREGPDGDDAGASPRLAREIVMNRRWQNRTLSELVGEIGAPLLIMNIPGGGNPPGFVVVYGTHAATGCIDAFALMPAPDPIVRIYHCR